MLGLRLLRELQERQEVEIAILLHVGAPLIAVAIAGSEVRFVVRTREVGKRAGEHDLVVVERTKAGASGERVALEDFRQAGAVEERKPVAASGVEKEERAVALQHDGQALLSAGVGHPLNLFTEGLETLALGREDF